MTTEFLFALGIPTAYLLTSTRRAIAGNTMVGFTIGLGALRWALSRE